MKSALVIGVAILLIGGAVLLGRSTTTPTSLNETTSSALTFELKIANYTYEPASVDVNLGDTVTLEITNTDSVTHGINLPAFGVQEFVQPGQTQTVTFIADQTGDPELFCSSDHGEKLLINVNYSSCKTKSHFFTKYFCL